MSTAPMLNHVAMSVPPTTLTTAFRAEVLDFFGSLGWKEAESLRLPDRLTLLIGGGCYLNLRERPQAMTCTGYEHVGIAVSSSVEVERLWHVLDSDTAMSRLSRSRLETTATGRSGSATYCHSPSRSSTSPDAEWSHQAGARHALGRTAPPPSSHQHVQKRRRPRTAQAPSTAGSLAVRSCRVCPG